MKYCVLLLLAWIVLPSWADSFDSNNYRPENDSVKIDKTNLPIVFIDTRHGDEQPNVIHKDYVIPARMKVIMNEDGTGLASDNGETVNNGFTWSVDGNQLTITPRSDVHYEYTVNSLTENECTFSGSNVPVADIPGAVVVHLVRVS